MQANVLCQQGLRQDALTTPLLRRKSESSAQQSLDMRSAGEDCVVRFLSKKWSEPSAALGGEAIGCRLRGVADAHRLKIRAKLGFPL